MKSDGISLSSRTTDALIMIEALRRIQAPSESLRPVKVFRKASGRDFAT